VTRPSLSSLLSSAALDASLAGVLPFEAADWAGVCCATRRDTGSEGFTFVRFGLGMMSTVMERILFVLDALLHVNDVVEASGGSTRVVRV
jgi:hypothetical protein